MSDLKKAYAELPWCAEFENVLEGMPEIIKSTWKDLVFNAFEAGYESRAAEISNLELKVKTLECLRYGDEKSEA